MPADLVACDLHYPSPHAVSDDDIRRFLQLETHPYPAARKERGMQQARVALYRVKPGTADEVIRHAEAHLVPAHRNQRGFVAYGLIKSGDAAVISLSIWNTAEQAAAAVQIAAAEQEHFAAMIEAVDDYIGDLAFFWELAAIGR
jgi:heme-degrading monooxygenase HmoA